MEMSGYSNEMFVLAGVVLALVFVFLCICVVCDKHLVPAVETIIEEFDVPEEIAAVTLIAFGSSSPEILLNTVSAFEGSGALSMPAMLGSAIIAFGLIPPLCVLSTSKENVDLETRPILRETFSFTVGLCLFTKIVADGSATLVESLLILSLYVVYVIVIIITYYCYKTSDHVPQHHEHSPIEDFRSMSEDKVPLIELVSAGLIGEDAGENTTATDDIIIDSAIPVTKRARLEKCCLRFFDCVSHPLVVFFNFSIPDLFDAAMCGARAPRHVQLPGSELRYGHSPFCCHTGKVTLFRALSVIAVSIGYVCIFATIVVELCGLITRYGGFDQTTVGATLVAFGAQLPDIVSSISLARDGYFNGAMANAIGSQVINITLGVGLPASVLCLYSKSETFEIVKQSDNSIKFLVGLSFIIILGYCLFTLPLLSFCQHGRLMTSTSVNRRGSYALLLLFAFVMTVYIALND